MGFKTDYKEITLKELANLDCFSKQMKVELVDYNAPISSPGSLTGVILLDDIPDKFADWFVEYVSPSYSKERYSALINYLLLITIREP